MGKLCYLPPCYAMDIKAREYDKVSQYITNIGYTLVTPLPTKFTERVMLSLVCPNGHVTSRRLSNLKVYPKCQQCQLSPSGWYWHMKQAFPQIQVAEKLSKKSASVLIAGQLVSMTLLQISTRFQTPLHQLYGFELIQRTERRNRKQRNNEVRHHYRCKQGHEFQITEKSMSDGHGCRQCATQSINEPELLIGEWIENKGINVIRRDIRILNGEELDIFIPTHSLAIEYCGIRWHSVEINTRRESENIKFRHQNKLLKCRDLNIRLITVFESDFHYKREYVKSVVLDALQGKNADTPDLRYRQLMPREKVEPPQPHYYDSNYKERTRKSKYTVYDCGYVILEGKKAHTHHEQKRFSGVY